MPRHWRSKFHIVFAHARQLHLTWFLLRNRADDHDVFFVDQLSTCVPLLRILAGKRVVFYCHFPDKLLAGGVSFDGAEQTGNLSLMKRLYRYPMDWLEELTTSMCWSLSAGACSQADPGQADIILANSEFTARVTVAHLPSLKTAPRIVYPGINISAYRGFVDGTHADIQQVTS